MVIEIDKMVEEFNKDLNYWNYDEVTGKRNPRGDIRQIQQSLGAISKNLNFPKKIEMYNQDIDDYIEYDYEDDPDAVQRNWVRNQMSKIDNAREGLNKVRVFPGEIGEQPEVREITTAPPLVNLMTDVFKITPDKPNPSIEDKTDNTVMCKIKNYFK